jgi:hypothetical protein
MVWRAASMRSWLCQSVLRRSKGDGTFRVVWDTIPPRASIPIRMNRTIIPGLSSSQGTPRKLLGVFLTQKVVPR